MYTIPKHQDTCLPVVNLVSETVDGCKGHGVHTAFVQTREALTTAGSGAGDFATSQRT